MQEQFKYKIGQKIRFWPNGVKPLEILNREEKSNKIEYLVKGTGGNVFSVDENEIIEYEDLSSFYV